MKKAMAALTLLIPLAACGSAASSSNAAHGAAAPVCRVNVVYPNGTLAQVTVDTADCSDSLAATIAHDLTADVAAGAGPSSVYVTGTKSSGAVQCGGVMDGSTATVLNPGSGIASAAQDVCGTLFSPTSDF